MPSTSRMPRHAVIDGFLDANLHRALLDYALDSEDRFAPTEVGNGSVQRHSPEIRTSWFCRDKLGPHKQAFREAVRARFDELRELVGVPAFEPARIEVELAAHRDACFYRPHIDTQTGAATEGDGRDRVLTMVYYFHRQPRGFSGGAIALFPFGPGEPELIDPFDNRLVVFPSIALHEVRAVTCRGDAWQDARFAINTWFRRAPAD